MTREHFLFIPEVSLLLQREDRVFLLRRCNTGYKDGEWCMPAGHKEPVESPLAAAIREAKEEAGIDAEPGDLELLHVMHRQGEHERIAFCFRANEWSGEPANVEPHKCDAVGWFPLSALPEPMVDYHALLLERITAGQRYSEAAM